MVINTDQIQNYIPTREPFVMIDKLVSFEKSVFVSHFTITKDNLFLDNHGVLREYALVENIAQTASVGIILRNQNGGLTYSDGYIGGIKNLFVFSLPKIDDTIKTKVQVLTQLGSLHLVKGECFVDNKSIFECELKLAGKK